MAVRMARNPREDLHLLSTTGSFLHLQEIAFLLKEKYSDPVDLCRVQNISFRPQEIDSVALSILQPASVFNINQYGHWLTGIVFLMRLVWH